MADRLQDRGMIALTDREQAQFAADGFLVREKFLSSKMVMRLRARFAPLFRGEFETGLHPDECNWRKGRDPEDRTRQICNAWKSDRVIASCVLAPAIGRIAADLAGWPGTRIGQDNVISKPPGSKSLSYHQDDSYCRWAVPSGYVTCWMALDDTTTAGGTIEYAVGSHRWDLSPMVAQFHAPQEYRAPMEAAARRVGVRPDILMIEVPAGGCVIHHGRIWHGSGPNRSHAFAT